MIKVSKRLAVLTALTGLVASSAVTASAALNLPTQNCAYVFTQNTKLGSRSAEVMNLQKVLNMFPQTMVAATGAGSMNMETNYFGPATKAAVIKFQNLHMADILSPAGLTAGNGNVFALTRAVLNQICVSNGTTPTNPINPTGPVTTGGPVSANLSGSQPTGMIVQGQSGARLADFTFTGNGTVTSVQLQRTGVSANATLNNVYLYDGNVRITDGASVTTNGLITFNSPQGLFTVNGSRTITVRADIAASTTGQSVGVMLTSVSANGGTSTFTNVMGNSLTIAGISTATVNFSTISTAPATPDAGVTNYTVWSGSATVSLRDVNLKAATFKFVGSAPADAIANLGLFVDGTKVASGMINTSNNNKVTFDLGYTPFLLKTGGHTIEVRGDIVKGSNRTITFSVENVADLMLEDSNLSGVNVSATVNSSILTQGNSTYRTITVNKGSVTVNVDPAFVTNKVTGGATNVTVGQFTFKAYGEDVKIQTLNVAFASSTNSGIASTTVPTLNNVSLYVNGGQVGTSQNLGSTSTTLTYTLGSSLIVPANTTVTVSVKADIVNASNGAYATGTIVTTIGGVALNAQGQSSNELVSVASNAVLGNALTISSGAGTFARTAGFSAVSVAPNTAGVKIGSFTIQANSAEDIKVNQIGVNPVVATYGTTNLSNLRVMSNGSQIGTPVGNPAAGTSTFSFPDIVILANSTRTFDVYADIGGASTGSVTAAMDITYRGAVSNTTTLSAASGVAITSAASTIATSTLQSSSPVSQFVVGGSSFGVATFNLKTASAGTVATVRELRFSTTGTDAIESVTVGGVTAPVVSGTSTVTGLNILISSTGTDVPVTVKYSGFQNTTTGGSLQTSIASTAVTLSYVEATSGSGSVVSNGVLVSSNAMTLVASKPTVSVGSGNTDTLILGAENKVGEFTVTADANGKISVGTTSISLSAVGVTSPLYSAGRIADGNTTITGSSVDLTTASGTAAITFTPAYEISAGQSKTFSLFAVVNGTPQASITPYVTSRLTSGSTFLWRDVIGGNTAQTGTNIYNFPTNSFTTKR